MKQKVIVNASSGTSRKGKTDWKRVRSLTDEDITAAVSKDPDAELLTDELWKQAKLTIPDRKVAISLRVDRDVVDAFKKEGAGYQTRMNAVLRSYVEHSKRKR